MEQIAFKNFCDSLYKCAEKIEDEIKTNIVDSGELIMKNETIDVKLPLQKVKIYHYKEILLLMNAIKIDIKKILYHEQSIRKLENTKKLSGEEVKHYFSIESKSLVDLTTIEPVVRRKEPRRVSSTTLYTLSTWETYLKRKEQEESVQVDTAQSKLVVPKRNKPTSKRKQRKLVSSTFNDILDNENVDTDDFNIENSSILEEDEDVACNKLKDEIETEDKQDNIVVSSENKIVSDQLLNVDEKDFLELDLGRDCLNEETKPKIVDILYKKREDGTSF